MGKNPVIQLLEFEAISDGGEGKVSKPMIATHMRSMKKLFDDVEGEDTPEHTAHLLYAILSAQVKTTFHKINVHAAMSPAEVRSQFEPVISQAKNLQEKYKENQIPFVTVRTALPLF